MKAYRLIQTQERERCIRERERIGIHLYKRKDRCNNAHSIKLFFNYSFENKTLISQILT